MERNYRKIFNFKMEFQLMDYNDIKEEVNRIIDSYRNQFWID